MPSSQSRAVACHEPKFAAVFRLAVTDELVELRIAVLAQEQSDVGRVHGAVFRLIGHVGALEVLAVAAGAVEDVGKPLSERDLLSVVLGVRPFV